MAPKLFGNFAVQDYAIFPELYCVSHASAQRLALDPPQFGLRAPLVHLFRLSVILRASTQ